MTDVVAKTLEALRLRGTVYFEADFTEPWGMAIPARDVAILHVVAAGRAWLRSDGREPLELGEGDVVLLPQGMAHELVHSISGVARPAEEVFRDRNGAPGTPAAWAISQSSRSRKLSSARSAKAPAVPADQA